MAVYNINKRNKNFAALNVSIFVFFMMCYLPPYQDLYRRYIDTYHAFSEYTSVEATVKGHVDVIFYLLTYLAKKIGLPFYIVPALLSALTVYYFIAGIFYFNLAGELKARMFRFIILFILAMLPIVQLALGVRWGMGVALAFYGITNYIFCNNKCRGIIYLILSVLMHFSMALILTSFVISRLYKLNRFTVVFYSVIIYLISSFILPILLSHMGIIGQYATTGYTDNDASNVTGNSHNILVSAISFAYLLLFLVMVFINWNKTKDKNYISFRNFVCWFLVLCMIVSFSYIPFRRYLTGALYFYMGACYLIICVESKKIMYRYIILSFMFFSFVFNGIYLQRRPILLSKMWEGLYSSPIFLLGYGQNEYNKYLKVIDSDGDWVEDKINNN